MALPVQQRSPFRERLGTYLMGVAIGCMIVGFMLYGRSQAKQRQAAERAAAESQRAPEPQSESHP